MQIQERYSLKPHNTLSLQQATRYFARVTTPAELEEALAFARQQKLSWFVLGAGSNLVLSRDYPGLVLCMALKGIERIAETQGDVRIRVAAGENWHHLVQHCLERGWYGLENLALIPGTAGAAPVQNIGAYGIELCDVLEEVEAWDERQQAFVTLAREQCAFGYRDSLFKREPGRYVILAIVLRLSKVPFVNIAYESLRQCFAGRDPATVTPADVFEAVVSIRRSRLPDPGQLPNAGSFFKNPVVDAAQHAELIKRFPNLVSYPAGENHHKLAAGWLIDQAGWKGRRVGCFGVHEAQALVLVHYPSTESHGGESGQELLQLASAIQDDVRRRYGVSLEVEPVIL